MDLGKYKFQESDTISLAALELFTDYGNDHEYANKSLKNDIDKYIPQVFKGLYSSEYWFEKVMKKYTSLNFSTKMEAKLAYIDHIKTQDLFESHQFYVKV